MISLQNRKREEKICIKATSMFVVLLIWQQAAFTQNLFPITYQQLKAYEGLYEYSNHNTLKIAASPKDTMLYAIINESKYPLTSFEKDIFKNSTNDLVIFLRDKSDRIRGYVVGRDSFNLISRQVVFPKEMWYPRIGNSKYVYHPPAKLKDGLPTGDLDHTGLDKMLLDEMIKKIVEGVYPNVHSVLIIKDGKLVFEEYFYEYNRDQLHELRSATKSFISALTGIAIQQGFIKSENESVLAYFPEYQVKNNSDSKSRITIKHLLTNQSGLDCDISDPRSEGNETVMGQSDDWVKFTLDLPMVDTPGGTGRYCSGNPVTLGRIIEKATHQTLPAFARKSFFKEMEIKKFKWNFQPDKSSSESFCQLSLRPRDMAKFGLLYLNNGVWNGKQIVPAVWVGQSLTKHSVIQGVDYGYLWWIKYLEVNGRKYFGMAAQGNGGQKIYIWEELNMVTVITGGNFNTQSPSDELIRKYILASYSKKVN